MRCEVRGRKGDGWRYRIAATGGHVGGERPPEQLTDVDRIRTKSRIAIWETAVE